MGFVRPDKCGKGDGINAAYCYCVLSGLSRGVTVHKIDTCKCLGIPTFEQSQKHPGDDGKG